MSTDLNLFGECFPERWDTSEPQPEWKGQAIVFGPAQTQGSKQGFLHPKLKRVVIVDANDHALKGWRSEWVGEMAKCRPGRPVDSAVAISILVYVRRPSAHYGSGKNAGILKSNAPVIPPSGKDNDKICRAILDAGQIAGWYTNDARVADLQIKRRYDEGIERVIVWGWTLHSLTQGPPDFGEMPVEPEAEPF
jgi:Holliday junction resolvase RusA-like endonuclease